MKEQRIILKVIVPTMLVALAFAIVLDLPNITNSFLGNHGALIQNIMIGIFSSSFLLTITSWLSYFIQRKSAINQYWVALSGFNQKVSEFAMLYLQESAEKASSNDEYFILIQAKFCCARASILQECTTIFDRYADVNLAHSKISYTIKKKTKSIVP